MKTFNWNQEKNELLKQQRGISFEQMSFAIESGCLLDKQKHSNQERYPGQELYYIEFNNYIYVVPCVETENEIFMKIIIPNRKATKALLGDQDEK